jgi:hypothetical protein
MQQKKGTRFDENFVLALQGKNLNNRRDQVPFLPRSVYKNIKHTSSITSLQLQDGAKKNQHVLSKISFDPPKTKSSNNRVTKRIFCFKRAEFFPDILWSHLPIFEDKTRVW